MARNEARELACLPLVGCRCGMGIAPRAGGVRWLPFFPFCLGRFGHAHAHVPAPAVGLWRGPAAGKSFCTLGAGVYVASV